MHLLKNQKGVTLIELTVATGIFVIIVVLVTNIFKSVIDAQRSVIAAQSTQESMRFVLEMMSKEIRNASSTTLGSVTCPGPVSNELYNTNIANNILYFRNKENKCVKYYLANDVGNTINRLVVSRDGISASTTPKNVHVTNLAFSVDDNLTTTPPDQKVQPTVTFRMTIEMGTGQLIHRQSSLIQTTISARQY